MTLGMGTMQFMQGHMWPAIPGYYGYDINGVAISVGSVVKFTGVVTAINVDPHFGTIQVTATNPTGVPSVFQSGGGEPRSSFFSTPNPQKPAKVYGFEPLQLVVGS